MNRIILLSVDDAWIKRSGETAGASGSAGAVTLRMTFDSAWDGTSKTVYFTDALGENSVKVLLGLDALVSDNTYDVPVPGEAMTQPGQATVTVVGESEGRVITTQAARFRVLDAAIPPRAGNSQPITPDEAAQLQAQIDALEEIFVTNRQQAQDAAQQAESAKDAVQEAIDNIPPGAVLVINDLTTGGTSVALSAEQGKKLDETKADRQLSNLDTPQAALVNLGACTNPNKLINGDFLINQKNWSRTESAITQKIHDMWELSWTPGVSGSAEALQDGGVKVDSTTVSGFDPGGVITNKFEGAINGTWTLSVYMKVDSLPAGSNIAIQVANDTKQSCPGYSITSETAKIGAYEIYTLTTDISGWEDSDTMRVSVYNYGGPAVFSVKAVKLEPGKSQTRAYLKSDGTWELLQQPESEYFTQLLKCQYYGVSFGKSLTWESVGFGEATSETSIMAVVPIPIALRIKPTAMLTGTLNLRSGSQVLECTSLFVDVFGPSTVLINASVTGATPGAAYDVFVPPGSFLILDCSL